MRIVKKLIGLTLVGSTFGLVVSSSVTHAADAQKRETTTGVTFEEDTGKELPKDPLDPDIPLVPDGPGGEGTDGPLSIDFASNFMFGNVKLSPLISVTHKAIAQNSDRGYKPLFVQVSDKTGTHAGWSLTVRQNGQLKNQGQELIGAELSLTGGQLATISQASFPSTVTERFKLNPAGTGESQLVVKADEDEGAGQFLYRFGNGEDLKEVKDQQGNVLYQTTDHVTLTIPAGTTVLKGNYETRLTWTLSNVPSTL